MLEVSLWYCCQHFPSDLHCQMLLPAQAARHALSYGKQMSPDMGQGEAAMMRPEKNAGGGQLFSSQLLVLVMVLLSSAMVLAQDAGWPRQITKPGGKVVLYQPQVDDWKNYQQVDARMAFTVTPTGGQNHVGVVTVQLKSAVNMDDHTVFLSDPQITSISFPSLDAATTAKMDQLMRTFLNPAATMTIFLSALRRA